MVREGVAFSAAGLWRLLRNPMYKGAVNWHSELQAGEQESIVEAALWQRVNTMLAAPTGTEPQRHGSEAPLRGLRYSQPARVPWWRPAARRRIARTDITCV